MLSLKASEKLSVIRLVAEVVHDVAALVHGTRVVEGR